MKTHNGHARAGAPGKSPARQQGPLRLRRLWVGLLLMSLATVGCSSRLFLTESGPTRGAIVHGAARIVYEKSPGAQAQYEVVMLDNADLARSEQEPPPPPPPPPGSKQAVAYRGQIGIGDILGVTIFEAGSSGLLLPREGGSHPGNFVTLPPQEVDANGDITAPYAGEVKAVGLLPAQLGTKLESLLSSRAWAPQVVVTIVRRSADRVTVVGEVARATSFSLGPGGASLLGAIAKAGGTKYPAYESRITLQRNGRLWRVGLRAVERNPDLNEPLMPGDTIYVSRVQRYFIAMGAIGQSTSLGPVDPRIAFRSAHLSLMDALGRAGGLNDELANARAVFVYRLTPQAAQRGAAEHASSAAPPDLPTIYLLNLANPAGFFYASRFQIDPEDVVYVANAPATDLQKFLTLMLGASAAAAYVRETIDPYVKP